jgi:hypothetical protein
LAKREMTAAADRETRIARQRWRSAAAVVAIGAFLTFTNPFGATADLPIWGAFLYWTLLVGEGWFGGTLIGSGLALLFPPVNPLLNRALSTSLVAVLVCATIIAIQFAIGDPVPLSFWPMLYVLVLGISVAIAAVGWLVERAFDDRPGAITHAPAPGAAPTPVRFFERLPAKLRGAALYAVSSEDHYLRLHTSKGSDLILMRLSDAISELEGLEGAQTHRSWWVAREAVESARRDGDRVTLVLKSGAEAPVSRPNVKPLREAGWF